MKIYRIKGEQYAEDFIYNFGIALYSCLAALQNSRVDKAAAY